MSDAYEREVSDLLKKIFMPMLLVLGLIGNGLSIIIFSQPSMRKYTTFRYLTFISILDLGCLYMGGGPLVLQVYFDVDIRVINELACKVISFIVYFFTHSSSMLLALMSVDRTIAITIQLGKTFSTPKTAAKLFITVVILAALLNSPFLIFTTLVDIDISEVDSSNGFNCSNVTKSLLDSSDNFTSIASTSVDQLNSLIATTETSTAVILSSMNNENFVTLQNGNYLNNCTRNPVLVKYCYATADTLYYVYITKFFTWIDLCFYAIIPFIIMFLCSTIIIIKTFQTSWKLSSHGSMTVSKNRSLKNKQLLYILFSTNCLFICMVSPLVLLNAFNQIQENTVKTTISYILSYSNHALNFIFYGISCEKYREELFKLLNGFFKVNRFKSKRHVTQKYENINFAALPNK